MILDCCAQQRTYEKFFGLLAGVRGVDWRREPCCVCGYIPAVTSENQPYREPIFF